MQRVRVGETFSEPARVTSGVIEGSVLGSLLFILFINKINSSISSSTKTFADDTKLYRKMASHTDKVIIQEDVNKLTENLKNLGLNFNTSKTKVIQIGKRKETAPQLTIKSRTGARVPLETVESEKDLGIIIDSQLKFHNHTKK